MSKAIQKIEGRKKQVHIDATLSFSPGNEVLILYLLRNLNKRGCAVIVHARHARMRQRIESCDLSHVKTRKTSFWGMLSRMLRPGVRCLYFCSIPPLVRQPRSIVYFHAANIAEDVVWRDPAVRLRTKLKRWLLGQMIRRCHKNPGIWFCQTAAIKARLQTTYPGISVSVLPFYEPAADVFQPEFDSNSGTDIEFDFIYPATADVHKNHFRLFAAVQVAARQEMIKLCVTIPEESGRYIQRISEVNQSVGYEAIINAGRISRACTLALLARSRALVFPSLKESLGLPLVEAAELGKPVLVSDLPYAHAVLDGARTFDPMNPAQIAEAMLRVVRRQDIIRPARSRIGNNVEVLIDAICA
ncbi:MAG: glycosyltransferase [Wenzhouxiangella sp.]|nr:glycosyltransferase [Wenzhouxiangella sp.]